MRRPNKSSLTQFRPGHKNHERMTRNLSAGTQTDPQEHNSTTESGLLFSGLAMFALSRSFLSPWSSLLAAVFYALAPYHIVELYQR
jgi:hypothetical protein